MGKFVSIGILYQINGMGIRIDSQGTAGTDFFEFILQSRTNTEEMPAVSSTKPEALKRSLGEWDST